MHLIVNCPKNSEMTLEFKLGGHHFLWNRGVMNFRKYLGNIFVTPLFDDHKFYDPPPPSGATMLKKHVTPNARSAENMHFGAISLNKIFIKICSHPIISWFFCDSPISHEKKILWPPAFSWPPIRKKMIAPLAKWYLSYGWKQSKWCLDQ